MNIIKWNTKDTLRNTTIIEGCFVKAGNDMYDTITLNDPKHDRMDNIPAIKCMDSIKTTSNSKELMN